MAVRWVTTNVRFDPNDYADLQRLAAASGSSLAQCIRMAVGAYLGHPGPASGAGEAAPPYAARAAQPEVPAVVHGATLVLEGPLPGLDEGARVFVQCLSVTEMAERSAHRRMLAALRQEFEALPPGRPARLSDDDVEIYKP